MYLHIHSDASYLSEIKARSRAGGLFFLSNKPATTAPNPDSIPPPLNGGIHIHCSIMKAILSSATEAETGALFYNTKDAAPLRIPLPEMGHPQPASPIQTDNACASGIVNNTVKQRRSKAMDMWYYWVCDCIEQGQYTVIYWRKGADNLADCFMKHHSPSHHRLMRSRYLLDLHKEQREHKEQVTNQNLSGKGVLMSTSGLPQSRHRVAPVTAHSGTRKD
jgi:hypothetical protein